MSSKNFFVVGLITLLWAAPVVGQDASEIPLKVETQALVEGACSGQFVAHDLDYTSTVPGGGKVRMFDANGGGVAINDLDGDGQLDIVFANQSGQNTILWNTGDLNFRADPLGVVGREPGNSRAAETVDVDGDGLLDIVFSGVKNPPTYWHNNGNQHFTRQFLSGVGKPVYAINWADLNGDGSLDLVGATYDASLLTDYGQEFLTSGNAGVFYYENHGGKFRLNTLESNAQALAVMLLDLNGDGHLDIWIGNDFGVPDMIWYWSDSGWQREQPLRHMSYSTMSLDFGDINNDGVNEVFSSDMQPYPGDDQGATVMPPILDDLNNGRDLTADPQITANVLQSIGGFTDSAAPAGIDATGWSWSGKFGDLNQDGFLDLYVVNGFDEMGTFPNLPNHELVEANQAFRNMGNGTFTHAPEWNLGSIRGGRGMSMADLDGDGDLDIVVNNLNSPAQLFENQLCEGASLEVDLRWSGSPNTRAIGATLILHTDKGTYYRDVKAASGYLSGDPARIHFGFPQNADLQLLEIHWPDGAMSRVEKVTENIVMKVTREE
ncbi:MAG: CRTAC1 family protein [Chloroflexota bacterium]